VGEKLTFEQRQAVENRGGKLLVSAAAGSGKTKVLVDRLMGYILDPLQPANIDDFLIITYTKAAAGELRGKIAAKLSELVALNPSNRHLQQQMQRLYLSQISTVHGFCTELIRQYAYRLDVSADFRVADEGECLELQLKVLDQILNEAYEKNGDYPDFCAFVDTQGLGRDDRLIPEIVLKVYNSARCHLDPMKWLDWCVDCENLDLTAAEKTPWGQYLIADLKQYLQLQIEALNQCAAAAEKASGMEKPAALFSATAVQLQTLYNCQTWDEIMRCKEIDYGRLTFSKNCTDLQLAEQMKAIRNACKEGVARRLRSFSDDNKRIMEDFIQSSGAAKGLIWLVRLFMKQYDKAKKNRGVLDFGDLEHMTLDLLLGKQRSGPTRIADEVGERFREIMVDEYQDTNGIQDAIFSALTQKRQNCFMVGDVKQSIYQFRLADPSIFINKYNTYASVDKAVAGEGRKVLLSHNFRSSGGVIAAVNDVFSQCMSPAVGGLTYGDSEMLREGIAHVSLEEPEVSLFGIEVEQDTYREESAFVADKIDELLHSGHMVREGDKLRPIVPEDIAILLRSPGSVGGEFQYALQCRGIRCVTGDAVDLLQTEEISTVRGILQVIDNPLQDIPLVTVLTSPVFGYTAEELAALRVNDRNACVYALIKNAADEKSRRFLEILSALRQEARFSSVTQLLTSVYTGTNLLSVYSAMPDGAAKADNLQTFFQIVSDYETTGPKELSRLLEHLDAAQERGLGGSGAQQDKGAVTIMSIHKSKGLEFPVVFLCGLSRGFNQESAHSQVLCDKDLGLGLNCVDISCRVRYPTIAKRAISTKIVRESVSEELRVLYVAMTRARDRLFMTYAVKNLDAQLQDLAMRMGMCSEQLLAADIDCPGEWVLQAALKRSEAGAFFAIGGNPGCANVNKDLWHIDVVSGASATPDIIPEEETDEKLPGSLLQKLRSGVGYTYGHDAATQIPSKLTATQLKGRVLDTEIAGNTKDVKHAEFRKPGSMQRTSGKNYGNAMHTVLQYIQFAACDSVEGIQRDIERMVREKLIDPEQAKLADCEKLAAFFATPLGLKLQSSKNVLREFKFSILDDASKYYQEATDEQILLQGIVDCALIEENGITVVDFKTDYVTEETLPAVTEKYRLQVLTYAGALERIYQMPIQAAALYFFHLNRFVSIIH